MADEATGGHVEAGASLIERYGCGACHEIPGIPAASGHVGPPLESFTGRAEIAGLLVNEPTELVFRLREPQTVKPGNGMPNQGITDIEARDIAAYLLTLNRRARLIQTDGENVYRAWLAECLARAEAATLPQARKRRLAGARRWKALFDTVPELRRDATDQPRDPLRA